VPEAELEPGILNVSFRESRPSDFTAQGPLSIPNFIEIEFYQPAIPDAIFNKSFTTRRVIMCAATYYQIKKDGISMFL